MEGSMGLEVNQRSECTSVSKSLIRIDSISIDLTSAMEGPTEGSKCEHFSMRGYVAEMRKKDMSICVPFSFDGNQNKLEEQIKILPPLDVAKFRYWRCPSCLHEIGASCAPEEIGGTSSAAEEPAGGTSAAEKPAGGTSAAEETEVVPNHHQSGSTSNGTCSHVALVLPDLQQDPVLENAVGKRTVSATTNASEDKIHQPSPCGYNKEQKDEVGHTAVVGYENGAGDDANQEIHNLTHEPGCPGSKSSALVEFSGPSGRYHATADVDILESVNGRSLEICQTRTLNSTDEGLRIPPLACESPKEASRVHDGINVTKGQVIAVSSLQPEEPDNLSSESDDILAESRYHDQKMNNSGGLIRQKTRKVRLLTELLGSEGNAETDRITTEGGPSSEMPNTNGLDALSAIHSHMTVQGSLKRGFGVSKGKRKIPTHENLEPIGSFCSSRLAKKPRVSKGDEEITNMQKFMVDSDSEEDMPTKVLKRQWTQGRINRNSIQIRKNKQTKLDGGHSPLMPRQEVILQPNQLKIGDADKVCAAVNGSSSKSAGDAIMNGAIIPYVGSSLPPQQTLRKSSLSKKQNKKPVEATHACLTSQRSSMLEEGSIMRKDSDMIRTELETVQLQAAHDATARKGLDLNKFAFAHRNKEAYITQAGDGIDMSSVLQECLSLREYHHQRKDIVPVGDSSIAHKSAPDKSFRKGLLCDLNENFNACGTPSTLREMQNLVPHAESGSFSHTQPMDFSGLCNSKSTNKVEERENDDIPMEIVELLARNQYERRCDEAEKAQFLSEQKNAGLMSFPKVHRNGVPRLLQEENCHTRKPQSGVGMFTTSDNLETVKKNPTNCFSEINGNHFSMRQWEGISASSGFRVFSQYQERQASGVQMSDNGSLRNPKLSNHGCNGDKVESPFATIPILQAQNSRQKGSQQSEAAEFIRSSLIPNHMPLGLNMPKYAASSSNSEMHSQFPVSLREGGTIRDIDLNVVNPSADNLEKKSRKFESESFRRASAENPFVCKHRDIDLNAKAPASVDLHPNDTIPALQLLSLMDAGMQSSPSFSLDGKSKHFSKPLLTSDHHPRFSLNGTSTILEKPSFPYNNYSREFSGQGIRLSSAFWSKNHSVKSCESASGVGGYTSLFKNEGNFIRGSGFTGHVVSSRSEEKGKAVLQNRGHRLQKPESLNGISYSDHYYNPIQNKKKGLSDASKTMFSQLHTFEGSTSNIDLEASHMDGTGCPARGISQNEVCTVNRNPADFSIPEAGNEYMIRGQDLKFGKKIGSSGRSGTINLDGRKRQRVTKPKAVRGLSQPHSS
ncbi:hypothetical protein NMG60_11000839 [Bertholletia excelsa]